MNDSTLGPQHQQLWNSLLKLVKIPTEAWPKFSSFYSAVMDSDEPERLLDDFFRQHAVDVGDREKPLVLVMAHYKAEGYQELLDNLLLAAEKLDPKDFLRFCRIASSGERLLGKFNEFKEANHSQMFADFVMTKVPHSEGELLGDEPIAHKENGVIGEGNAMTGIARQIEREVDCCDLEEKLKEFRKFTIVLAMLTAIFATMAMLFSQYTKKPYIGFIICAIIALVFSVLVGRKWLALRKWLRGPPRI